MPIKAVVTGGAGFIASHLQDALVKNGYEVTSIDIRDMSCNPLVQRTAKNKNFSYVEADVLDTERIAELMKGADIVFHMASNTDIRKGSTDPSIDYEMTFGTTHSVLEAMRLSGVKKLFFPSSSAVYGVKPGKLKESLGCLRPVSYYGGYKLACESLISAYSSMVGIDALVFRLPNVIGPGITHGVIYDLISKLKKDKTELEILGNGKQNKQYLYVSDAVKGIMDFTIDMGPGMDVYNISTESFINVDSIAQLVCERMGADPVYHYTGGSTGWNGDVPSFGFDIDNAMSKGWRYEFDSESAVRETLSKIDIDSIPPME